MAMLSQADDRSVVADYLTEQELASQLDVGIRTIREWRSLRTGPPVTWLGQKRNPAYHIQSVKDWLRTREQKMPRERSNRQAKEYRAT